MPSTACAASPVTLPATAHGGSTWLGDLQWQAEAEASWSGAAAWDNWRPDGQAAMEEDHLGQAGNA